MTNEEIKEIFEKHKHWLKEDCEGGGIQMSELKAIQGVINGQQFDLYFKDEADKFIAELEESHKMEVEQLLIEIVKLKQKINEAQTELELWRDGSIISEAHQKELDGNRHSNYKRCLAMADMCRESVCFWDNVKYTYFKGEAYCFRKLKHYGKWGQIWLSIAYKFKETK